MIAIATFLVVALLSLIVTRLATGALIATGMSPDVARFQARSAFTTAGFTTAESEVIMGHYLRRRIISIAMLVGSLGIPTLVVTVVLGFAGPGPGNTVHRMLVFVVVGVVILQLLSNRWVERHIVELGEGFVLRRIGESVRSRYDEMLAVADDHVVGELTLRPGAPLVGSHVRSLGRRPGGMVVLGLRRHGPDGTVYVDRPGPDTSFEQEDVVVLYGSRGDFEEMAAAPPTTDHD